MPSPNNADKSHFMLNFAVGRLSKNIPSDVLKVQKLLNFNQGRFKGSERLAEDGMCGSKTTTQIELFQKHVSKFINPDSVVSPSGRTYHDLIRHINLPQKAKEKISPSSTPKKNNIDINKFIALLAKEFPAIKNTVAIRFLLNRMLADTRITHIAWIPYIFATILKECHVTFEPIEEWRKGRGTDYGKPVKFIDPETNKEYTNCYYGRGYVQLTWDFNYISIGKAIGMGYKLAINPDLALERDIAYEIMIHGMVNGIFTRRKISTYINSNICDFINARRVINGLDKAEEIARNAHIFYDLIKSSQR